MDKCYKNCYIAFIDMLGVKKLINNEEFEYLLSVFEQVRYSYEVKPETVTANGETLHSTPIKIKTKIISDSICMYLDANIPDNLILLIATCSIVQWKLLNLKTPIFVRGGIVKGKLFSDGGHYFR